MKEIKVQQDILALANNTPYRAKFGKLNDGRMGVTIDGCALYIINIGNLLLDTTKFSTIELQKICDDVFNAKDIFPTGVSINEAEKTLKEFKNDETTAYFNERLFKYFDSKKRLTYSYHKAKLFIFEDGELVGLVIETRVKK